MPIFIDRAAPPAILCDIIAVNLPQLTDGAGRLLLVPIPTSRFTGHQSAPIQLCNVSDRAGCMLATAAT